MKDFNTLYKEAHSLSINRQKELRAALFTVCGEMFAHLPTEKQLERALNYINRVEDARQYQLAIKN